MTTPADHLDRPARPVVINDGECPFCLRSLARFQRRDKHDAFEYVPRQTDGLDERFPKLAEGDFNTGMRLIHADGSIDVGADAVYGIARRGSVFRWFAWLYRVPGLTWVFRKMYAWVAANRYRLGKSCDDGACAIPRDD